MTFIYQTKKARPAVPLRGTAKRPCKETNQPRPSRRVRFWLALALKIRGFLSGQTNAKMTPQLSHKTTRIFNVQISDSSLLGVLPMRESLYKGVGHWLSNPPRKLRFVFVANCLLLVMGSGCSKPHNQQSSAIAGVAETVNGEWVGTYGLRFSLVESNGQIEGAVMFPPNIYPVKIPPHHVRGLRSGNLVELYYDVAHAYIDDDYPKGSYTNENSYTMRGVQTGDNISGMVIQSAGIGRHLTNWVATRVLSDMPQVPAIDETPIVEKMEPHPPDTNWIALKKSADDLIKANDAEDKAWSNLMVSTSRQAASKPGTKDGVPLSVYNAIAADAARRHPNDYSTQKFVIDEQTEAYKKLHP